MSDLRDAAYAPMVELVESIGESANLVVLTGIEVRFVATVECDRVLRVGDRAGQRLPAHLTSGGKAILSRLADTEVDRFTSLGPAEHGRLQREVSLARRDGYATNHQETEHGLTAIGVALEPLPGPSFAAVCLAMPTVRFRRSSLDTYVAALKHAASSIEAATASVGTS